MLTWVIALTAALLAQLLEIALRPANRARGGVGWFAILALSALSFMAAAFCAEVIEDEIIDALLPLQVTRLSRYDLDPAIIFLMAFVLINLFQYALHFLMHKITFLWRLHAIHHSDEKVSALTGLLHHPAEALVSYFLILVLGILVGLPMIALVIYGFVSALHNAFVHADVMLPKRLDRILRAVIVTPSMHRTHHLASAREGNSNFGQIFSIWDRLFRTSVSDADLSGKLGLLGPERPKSFTALRLMAHPFERRLSDWRGGLQSAL